MTDPISDLLGIVREGITLYREIAEHAGRKTSVLVQGSVENILESNRVEETLNSRLGALRSRLERICEDLCGRYRIPREEFTLMKLSDRLQQSHSLQIREQAALLRSMAQQVKSIVRRNAILAKNSVQFAGGLLACIANSSGSYQRTGLFDQTSSIQPTYSQKA